MRDDGKKRVGSALINRQISGTVESNVLPSDEFLDLHLSSMLNKKDNSSFITGSYSKGVNELPSLKSLRGNLRVSDGPALLKEHESKAFVIAENNHLADAEYEGLGGQSAKAVSQVKGFVPNLQQSYESNLYSNGGESSIIVRSSRHR